MPQLCERDHLCPHCLAGGPADECLDIYMDPECGMVACCTGEADG